ncbi:MAG: hypothetical protein ACHQ4H_03955, partial [Ktedonobacterales bacterium]
PLPTATATPSPSATPSLAPASGSASSDSGTPPSGVSAAAIAGGILLFAGLLAWLVLAFRIMRRRRLAGP